MMVVDSLIVVKRDKYELACLCKETIDDNYGWSIVCSSDDLNEIPLLFKQNFVANFMYAKWDEDFFDMEIGKDMDKEPFLTMENLENRIKPLLKLVRKLAREENVIQREDLFPFLHENLARIWYKQVYPEKPKGLRKKEE